MKELTKLTPCLLTYKRQDTFSLCLVVDEGPAGWQLGAAEATLNGAGLLGDLLDTIIYPLICVPCLESLATSWVSVSTPAQTAVG